MLTCASFVWQAFSKIDITQLQKPMMSQFDDRLIIGYGKMMTSFRKIWFSQPYLVLCLINTVHNVSPKTIKQRLLYSISSLESYFMELHQLIDQMDRWIDLVDQPMYFHLLIIKQK